MPNAAHHDAIAIWKSAVVAVDSNTLVHNSMRVDGSILHVSDRQFSLGQTRHIEVVGAGKAGAGMAQAVEEIFNHLPAHITWDGWINVPDDCVKKLTRIRLFGARPAGLNEPTPDGVEATRNILRRAGQLERNDICLVLISGGGSALLPAPIPGITLDDKLSVTRLLSESGASIQELNTVRSQLSEVKAGGLAHACNAGRLITLIVSDVIGDPLEFIASGPTYVPQTTTSSADPEPLDILRTYDPTLSRVPKSVVLALTRSRRRKSQPQCSVTHHIIGNNQTALNAATVEASERGYEVVNLGSDNAGKAAEWGVSLFRRLQTLRPKTKNKPICVIAGGETTVELCDESTRGRGGRNQEIVLSDMANAPSAELWDGITLLSGGTDGEDGPTPAAGAIADQELLAKMHNSELNPNEFLKRNNAWPFFGQLGGLLHTGPTHTNVMDVQVGLARENTRYQDSTTE